MFFAIVVLKYERELLRKKGREEQLKRDMSSFAAIAMEQYDILSSNANTGMAPETRKCATQNTPVRDTVAGHFLFLLAGYKKDKAFSRDADEGGKLSRRFNGIRKDTEYPSYYTYVHFTHQKRVSRILMRADPPLMKARGQTSQKIVPCTGHVRGGGTRLSSQGR